MEKVDVVVIGAGLLGCFTARNLARYEMDILVLEKEDDVCRGISKANTGIIFTGYDNRPGSLKSRLCIQANEAFEELAAQLGVPFSRPGSLLISFGPRADRVIRRKYENGIGSGVKGLQLLMGSEARELEPGLGEGITSALYARGTGTVNPWELCIAAYENARDNGAVFRFGSRVRSLRKENGRFLVETQRGCCSAGAIVNAAGLCSDRVRELVGKPLLRLYPTAADYLVLDEGENGKIGRVIFHEGENGKGLTLVPTVDGNILVGPTKRPGSKSRQMCEGLPDSGFETDAESLAALAEACGAIVPSIDAGKQVRAFASLRPNPYRVREEPGRIVREEAGIQDFSLLEEDGLFSLIGIKTPGLTVSNELGRLAADKAAAWTGRTSLKKDFDPRRRAIVRIADLPDEKKAALIGEDPGCGEIICGCRNVSRSGILQAVGRGARDFEGVKRRTGAGMGRCQGSRCRKRILDILMEGQNADQERNGMEKKGKVIAVCTSDIKGIQKTQVPFVRLLPDMGIEGDAHAGRWHRQVSLLALEKIEAFREKGADVDYGAFGENIITEGFDLRALPVGTRLRIGDALLELTQIGKECHSHCAIYHQVGDCIMPREGVFAIVLEGGEVKAGDGIELIGADPNRPFTAAWITLSDKGAAGEREDRSGPLIGQILTDAGYNVVEGLLLPDGVEKLKRQLIRLADQRQVNVIFTTGGTGFSPRDLTPEATIAVCDRLTPGIAEAVRAFSMTKTPKAMLSRAAAGMRGQTLIINLPGSPKAVSECLEFLLEPLAHGLGIMLGRDGECGGTP